jgi:acyl-CoA synthetase
MTNTVLTLLSKERIDEYTASGHWGDQTIYMVVAEHARRTPAAWAVRDRRRRLTYRGLIDAADRLAHDLAARGVRRGQRVAAWLPSQVETAIVMLACSRNGYICCTSLHRDHTVAQVKALIERMRAAALLVLPGYGADADRHDLLSMVSSLTYLRAVYRLDPDDESVPFEDLEPAEGGEPATEPNRVVYLPFTSGTTGEPKGVMHSDNTLLANARALAKDWHFDADSIIYSLSPLSHNLGFGAMITAFAVGGELVVHDLPRGASLLDKLIETGATFLFGVPTHAVDLLSEMKTRGIKQLGAVKGFRISGAAAPREVVAELLRRGVMPQSGYGMTETCSHQYTLPTDDPQLIIETCGRSCPGYEVRIWSQDDPDVELPPGNIGQIGGRGASLMLGYFDDQLLTESSFNRLGWFMTGDLGWLDENGFLRITGRKKDIILRGGHNIYPARVEALTLRHPEIEMAAAFPIADPRLGERVCLAVVTRSAKELSSDAILQHLDEQGLSRYDMPEYMLFLPDLPLTASGKVTKLELVKWVEEGRYKPFAVRFQRTMAVGV